MSTASKVIAQTDRQTDRHTHTHTHTDMTKTLSLPHTREVKHNCHFLVNAVTPEALDDHSG